MADYNDLGAMIMGYVEEGKTDYLRSNIPKDLLNVYFRDQEGRTALHVATECGNEKAVELLLSCGMFPGVLDYEDKRPVDLARDCSVRQLLTSALNPKVISLTCTLVYFRPTYVCLSI